jgi:hypothetical protein
MDTSNPSQPGSGRVPVERAGKRAGLRGKAEPLGREVYWISLSAKDDAKPFGSVRGGETVLNDRGKALAACWRELAQLRPSLEPDALVIGPRRLQGILLFPAKSRDEAGLADAIRLFKVLSSLRLAQLGKTAAARRNVSVTSSGAPPGKAPPALWKKGFTEKPISGAAELAEARKTLKGIQAR